MQPEPSNPPSDSDSSNSSLDVLSTSPVNTKSGPARTIECKWVDCGKSFNYLDDLASHVTSFHANSGPGGLFFCGWEGCGRGDRGFNARYKMLVHVRTHTNEKPHHCFQCDKSFSRAENLKIHARSHTGERPYVCPVPGCGKAYSNSSDRFKHTRTHSVDKPYICKVPGCGKRYTDPSSLRKHVKTYRHFPTAQPAEDNQNKNIQNVFKMDEEMETEQIVPQTETNLTNLTPVSREEISQSYRYYRYNIEDNSDVRYEIFRNWFNREQMPWSHSDAQTLESKCRNYYNNHLQEQDMPLDLTVHK